MSSFRISSATAEEWTKHDKNRWRTFIGCVFWHETLGPMPLLDVRGPDLIMRDGSEEAAFNIDYIYFFTHIDFEAKGANAKQIEKELREEELKQSELAEIQRKKDEEKKRKLRLATEERERQAEEKKKAEEQLHGVLNRDYLNARTFYKNELSEQLTPAEYSEIKTQYIQDWIAQNSRPKTLVAKDLQQAAAVGSIDYHTLVSARAGSGKTSTLINRALFLHKHCGIGANQILMLAFNRDAAEEMRNRIEEASGQTFPHIMTFHALAYALVHPEKSILVDEPDGAQTKSKVLQEILDDFIHSPEKVSLVRKIMLAHFRQDWENIVYGGYDKVPAEMLAHRRSLPKEALDGWYYKSHGEKQIANFFLEHDIDFKYERNFWWERINYRPDFTLFKGKNEGVVIEYFGMEGEPDYDEMTSDKIDFWRIQKNWNLIEIYPSDLSELTEIQKQDFLRNLMDENGIAYNRLSEEEIWLKVKARAIDRLTKVIVNFLQRCRKLSLSARELEKTISEHETVSDEEEFFLELVSNIYESYLDRVKATGEDDFDGLLQEAVKTIQNGKTTFERKSGHGDFSNLRFILIDEYQDFSPLFYQMISAIRQHTHNANFFCVGDDWQAINGFAGSDLKYFSNFSSYYEPSRKLEITTNYRSLKSIVDTSNNLMKGRGTPAQAYAADSGYIKIVDMEEFQPTPREKHTFEGDNLTPVVLRLVQKNLAKGHNVVLLSRKNSLPWYVNEGRNDLEKFITYVRSNLKDSDKRRVKISTSHKYKGLQQPVVILLDAVERCYPLIHPDIIFNRIFGDGPEKAIEEDRRLFYVALTRAAKLLYIVTQDSTKTPFLDDIRSNLKSIDWGQYPPSAGKQEDGRLFVLIGNSPNEGSNPTVSIKPYLKADGFRWTTAEWPCWHKSFSSTDFTPKKFISASSWILNSDGLEIRFQNSSDALVAKCHINHGRVIWDKDGQ